MSTDYLLVCFTCKEKAPESFAMGSGFYGYKVIDSDLNKKWLGHKEDIGFHENHDLRIVNEGFDLPWELEP